MIANPKKYLCFFGFFGWWGKSENIFLLFYFDLNKCLVTLRKLTVKIEKPFSEIGY